MGFIETYRYKGEFRLVIGRLSLVVKDKREAFMLFSERNGYKGFSIGNYYFKYILVQAPTLEQRAWRLAVDSHRGTNHLYAGKPYDEGHLVKVVQKATKYLYLIPQELQETVIAAAWLHDVIEDCRLTYNDVKKSTNRNVAELVFTLTNDKGRTRDERAGEKYYTGLRDNRFALFIKLCDRLANVEQGVESGGSMLKRYEQEHHKFIANLNPPKVYAPMVEELEYLLNQPKP